VHYEQLSKVIFPKVNTAENTFVRVIQKQFNTEWLDHLKSVAEEHHAHFASVKHHDSILQGLDEA
jgi:hypothetical protein